MGYFRFRSPLLSESRFLSFPPGTEMVHFPGFARAHLWIQWAVRRFYQRGFPHSDIPGSMPACGSPRLIAACHVLHRHRLPRHPPCALSSLTIKFTQPTGLAADAASQISCSFAPAHRGNRKDPHTSRYLGTHKINSPCSFTQSIQLSHIVPLPEQLPPERLWIELPSKVRRSEKERPALNRSWWS